MPTIARTCAELQRALAGRRAAFVPTMGALHAGHAVLIRRAREVADAMPDGIVLVSIFVNPTQFGPNEDFARYPRQFDKDVEISEQAGADVIFAPSVEEMYPAGTEKVAAEFTSPALPPVATQPKLEDAFRPGHFKGVCQVVARLFDIVQPSHAIFGEKDYQQLQVIRAMVAQQHNDAAARNAAPSPAAGGNPRTRTSSSTAPSSQRWPGLHIIPHPTVREPDGLAMSSRNAYLNAVDRQHAGALWQAMQAASQQSTPRAAEKVMYAILHDESGFDVDYAVVRHSQTLLPVEQLHGSCRMLIAARIGQVRLIDNMMLPQQEQT